MTTDQLDRAKRFWRYWSRTYLWLNDYKFGFDVGSERIFWMGVNMGIKMAKNNKEAGQ